MCKTYMKSEPKEHKLMNTRIETTKRRPYLKNKISKHWKSRKN